MENARELPWDHQTNAATQEAQKREPTERTGKQLQPTRGGRTYRNTACTNVVPSQAPETSWRSVETTVFPASAFRSLSRQVLGLEARMLIC